MSYFVFFRRKIETKTTQDKVVPFRGKWYNIGMNRKPRRQQHTETTVPRQAKRVKKKFRPIDFLALIALVGLLILLFFTVRDYVRYLRLDFVTPEAGTWDATLPAEAVVVRQEYLLLAPIDGMLEKVAEESQRVTEGATVAYIDNGLSRQAITASKAGIVSYQIDGAESILSQENLEGADFEQLFALYPYDNFASNPGAAYGKGKVVAKIIDNLVDYTVVMRLEGSAQIDAEATSFDFYAGESTAAINGSVQDVVEGRGVNYLLLRVSSKEDLLSHLRAFDAELITGRATGQKIPATCLVQAEDGDYGVYYRSGNRVAFTNVEVLSLNDTDAVVEGIQNYNEVIANPEHTFIGQKLY